MEFSSCTCSVLQHVVMKFGCCNELSELQCCGVKKNKDHTHFLLVMCHCSKLAQPWDERMIYCRQHKIVNSKY